LTSVACAAGGVLSTALMVDQPPCSPRREPGSARGRTLKNQKLTSSEGPFPALPYGVFVMRAMIPLRGPPDTHNRGPGRSLSRPLAAPQPPCEQVRLVPPLGQQ